MRRNTDATGYNNMKLIKLREEIQIPYFSFLWSLAFKCK